MQTPTTFQPNLSAIVVFPDGYESRRRVIGYLTQQTLRTQLELVLVVAANTTFIPDPAQLAAFGSHQIVHIPEMIFPGQGFAAGVRAARAPVVAYVEEHSFPEPQWAEALVRAYSGPYAAVGAAMGNANPDALCSWVSLFEEFGPLVTPAASGVATYLGGHHTSYKRDVLLAYGDALPLMLENETALHIDLRARGHTLYLQGDAVSNHLNIAQPHALLRQSFAGQRSFAAARAHAGSWSFAKRALYILSSPLIPFVRFARVQKQMRRARRAAQLNPQIIPLLFVSLTIGTVGETVGYLLGDTPDNIRIRAEAELNREPFLAKSSAV